MSTTSTPTLTSQTTTNPFFSTSQPSASSNDNNNNTSPTSSSLYLFTFLATLLLLLAVSCAIVARSLVVRRRFRRRVEEAIAAGLIQPHQAPEGLGYGGGRRRDFGEKPTMWDSWIAPGDAKWSEVKPVSVKVISDTLTGAGLPRTAGSKGGAAGRSSSTSPHDGDAQPHRRLLSAIPFPLTYRRSPSPAPPSPSPLVTVPHGGSAGDLQSPTPPTYEEAKLQVSVLIAMPSPYRPQSWNSLSPDDAAALVTTKGKDRSMNLDMETEDDLPDVVFGVAEVPWRVRPDDGSPTSKVVDGTGPLIGPDESP